MHKIYTQFTFSCMQLWYNTVLAKTCIIYGDLYCRSAEFKKICLTNSLNIFRPCQMRQMNCCQYLTKHLHDFIVQQFQLEIGATTVHACLFATFSLTITAIRVPTRFRHNRIQLVHYSKQYLTWKLEGRCDSVSVFVLHLVMFKFSQVSLILVIQQQNIIKSLQFCFVNNGGKIESIGVSKQVSTKQKQKHCVYKLYIFCSTKNVIRII